MTTQIIADLVKYFAIALLTQVSLLIIFGVLIYVWMQHGEQGPLFFIWLIFLVYGWPYMFMGILAGPVTLVGYSFLFAVIKVRLQDRGPR